MLGGDAIRMAFALQLHKDLEHDPQRPRSNAPLSFVDREIRRRTMWASFLMDRFTSSGIDRPMFVKEEDVKMLSPRTFRWLMEGLSIYQKKAVKETVPSRIQ